MAVNEGHYDGEFGTLWFSTGIPDAEGSSASGAPDLVIFVGTDEGRDVVAFEIITSGGRYLRMEEGYDAEADTLTIGEAPQDSVTTENGDLVAYWPSDPEDLEPYGIVLRNAKDNLALIKIL